jgi:hypothetical protein
MAENFLQYGGTSKNFPPRALSAMPAEFFSNRARRAPCLAIFFILLRCVKFIAIFSHKKLKFKIFCKLPQVNLILTDALELFKMMLRVQSFGVETFWISLFLPKDSILHNLELQSWPSQNANRHPRKAITR